MTPATLGYGGLVVFLIVTVAGVLLKRADERRTRWANVTEEEA